MTKRLVGLFRKDSVLVELTKKEYVAMALLGTFRMLRAESLQVRAKHEVERTVRNDLQGILGKAAVVKALGRNVMDLVTIQRDVPRIDKPKGGRAIYGPVRLAPRPVCMLSGSLRRAQGVCGGTTYPMRRVRHAP